ncbi:MAG: hypothetical protein HFI19_09495 [Lachnospiraceae bacterium]|uniref:hypothetical protein n=1 Tax=Candidatus Merdisoma sp. JLR.KK006 TaxID=3112626 RepID=UPI002FEFBE8E|nr:hypothetical protein [Lachnospiraceae bacterium]
MPIGKIIICCDSLGEADGEQESCPARQITVNYAGGGQPWEDMIAQERLVSAELYEMDIEAGERGYNLAAILLIGKEIMASAHQSSTC